jgi:hypothetical protein
MSSLSVLKLESRLSAPPLSPHPPLLGVIWVREAWWLRGTVWGLWFSGLVSRAVRRSYASCGS